MRLALSLFTTHKQIQLTLDQWRRIYMNWMLDILVTHKRLRGLSEQQLRDLIEVLDDVKSLRTVKEFLELGSFRYQHIEHAAPELIERCIERAKESLWKQNEQKAREAFLESVGDPFALPM